MVIGNGLLATAFEKFQSDDDVIIFASGVSNSTEQNQSAFDRERLLLQTCLGKDERLVYFSTVSVHDGSLAKTPYIIFKNQIEELIRKESENFLILRLPILIGKTKNQNTLINFLFRKILNAEHFELHKNACRYLMNVSEVAACCSPIIKDDEFKNQTLDIGFDNRIELPQLVSLIEKITRRKANYSVVDKGSCYDIDNKLFLQNCKRNNLLPSENYNEDILKSIEF